MQAGGLSPRTAALTRIVLRRALADGAARRAGASQRRRIGPPAARPEPVPRGGSRLPRHRRPPAAPDRGEGAPDGAARHRRGDHRTAARRTPRAGMVRREREGARNPDGSPKPRPRSRRLGVGRTQDGTQPQDDRPPGDRGGRLRTAARTTGRRTRRRGRRVGRTPTASCSWTASVDRCAARGSATPSTTCFARRACRPFRSTGSGTPRRRPCWPRACPSWSSRATWATRRSASRRTATRGSPRSSSVRRPTRWTRRCRAARRERSDEAIAESAAVDRGCPNQSVAAVGAARRSREVARGRAGPIPRAVPLDRRALRRAMERRRVSGRGSRIRILHVAPEFVWLDGASGSTPTPGSLGKLWRKHGRPEPTPLALPLKLPS